MRNIHVMHIAEISHCDSNGNVLWKEENLDNILHDQGEAYILARSFATSMSGYAEVSNMYLGLDNRASRVEGNTLANLSGEPSGGGYARQALSTSGTGVSGQDFYISQPDSYYRADSKVITFTATADWSSIQNVFLCTASSGTSGLLISTVALSTPRILFSGDTLRVSIRIGLSE